MIRYSPAIACLVALVMLRTPVAAQIPGVPAAGAAGAASAVPGAAAPAAAAPAAPNNIWSKLMMTPAQKQQCKQKLCCIPIVSMLSSAMAPMSFMSGGLIGGCCPSPNDANPADLALPADSAQGAAARIKQNEAQARARRAAVRYLGTVDCRRYPEAEAALVASLRGDENECVRLEAALVLGSCCCCTRKTIQALTETVSGRRTNAPAETSERVKVAAAYALEKCLCKYTEEVVPQKPAEPGKAGPAGGATPPEAGKTASADRLVPDDLIQDARRVMAVRRLQETQRLAQQIAPPVPAPTTEPPTLPASVQGAERVLLQRTSAQAPSPQMAALATRPTAPPVETVPTIVTAPECGKRDVWNVFVQAIRGR